MENIRKVIAKERIEAKKKYKNLTGMAIDSGYNAALKIREEEQKAWDKFKFLCDLQEALDEVENEKD